VNRFDILIDQVLGHGLIHRASLRSASANDNPPRANAAHAQKPRRNIPSQNPPPPRPKIVSMARPSQVAK
jgi:hypothetical protein